MRSERRYLRLGDVHQEPGGGRHMWVYDVQDPSAIMRPLDARGPSEHVAVRIAEVAYSWPRIDDLGGRIAWVEPSEVLA
ncbi:hypothetical protein [Fimbriimonas ginsengisoli]|nr:hypothetical protein [Fimbriimonas ginsengisoli]